MSDSTLIPKMQKQVTKLWKVTTDYTDYAEYET